jgi:YfiH family protein
MAPAPYGFEVRAGLPVLTFPLLADHRVDMVVTTRAGGISTGPYATLDLGLHVGDDPAAVVANRERAAAAVGVDLEDFVFARQVHGRDVAEVGAADRGRGTRSQEDTVGEFDALLTRCPRVGVAVLVADCAPIGLYDPVTASLAVVHAGWRGAVAGVAAAAVEALAAGGSRREDILAFQGPAVPPEAYQVGEDVATAAAESFGSSVGDVLAADGTGKWTFDVWGANERVLASAGLRPGNVTTARLPTRGGRWFFSDRAERPCGRFALLAVLR